MSCNDFHESTCPEYSTEDMGRTELPNLFRTRLMVFLYYLMRDHVPVGVVNQLVMNVNEIGHPAFADTGLQQIAERTIDRLMP